MQHDGMAQLQRDGLTHNQLKQRKFVCTMCGHRTTQNLCENRGSGVIEVILWLAVLLYGITLLPAIIY